MFLVWRGEMRVEFRDRVVNLRSGEYCVAPRGVEHRTCADEEASVVLFEPAVTRNTGNSVDERFSAPGVTLYRRPRIGHRRVIYDESCLAEKDRLWPWMVSVWSAQKWASPKTKAG